MDIHNNNLTNNNTKLVSFNCRSITRSIECVRGLCRSADIVALQETWLQPQDISFLGTIDTDFEFTGKSAIDTGTGVLRGRPYGGVALLWRKNIFQSVSVIQCLSARIAAIKVMCCDRTILVFSVYMPTDSADNLAEFTECLGEMAAIVEEYSVDSVFMLGDYNAQPGERFGVELFDFCVEQTWRCADVDILGLSSDSYTYVSDIYGSHSWLDHCVVSEAAWKTVVDAKILHDVYWSDHIPLQIMCNFDLLKTKTSIYVSNRNKIVWGDRDLKQTDLYKNLCTTRLREIDFPSELGNCSDKLCTKVEHRGIIDKMYNEIVDILSSASCISYVGPEQNKRKPVIGWNKHVRQAHLEARLAFQNWVLCGEPKVGTVYTAMREKKRVFKSKLKWCQENREQIRMNIIASCHDKKDFVKFWKHTNQLNGRSSLPASVEGVSEPASIANLFKNHFAVKSPLGAMGEAMAAREPATGSVVRVSAKEITAVLRGMKRGKSPGHDSLSIEHLLNAGVHMPRVLALFFNFCFSHTYLPHDLMKTLVVPIIKNRTGDASDINNYRPISLATVIAKVLDSVLDKQLNKHLSLHDAQFGFRTGLSTEHAVLCLKHTVRYYTDRKTPVYACFLDLSKAFDLVSYGVLWKKLHDETTLPGELVELFKYWYGHQTNMVKWAGSLSDPYGLECGVRQGGLTSPKLFCLYVDRLIRELSSTMVGCSIDGTLVNNISYADDMVLLAPSISALKTLLLVCERYAEAQGLRYNAKKSECLLFKAGTKTYAAPPISLAGTALEWVTSFKYLGHWVTATQTDNIDMERERRALAVRSNMLIRRFAKCSSDVKGTLFRAYCQSFYTCSLWVDYTQRAYSALRVQYNNAYRALLRLPRHCSASGMFAEARIDDFYAIIRKRIASLMWRVRGSANSLLMTVADRTEGLIWKHWTRTTVLPSNRAQK